MLRVGRITYWDVFVQYNRISFIPPSIFVQQWNFIKDQEWPLSSLSPKAMTSKPLKFWALHLGLALWAKWLFSILWRKTGWQTTFNCQMWGCVKHFILITFCVLQDNHGTKVHDRQATTTMDLHTFLNPTDLSKIGNYYC